MVGILMIITAVTLIIIGKSLIKKMGMLLQDEQKIIYFCYLINQIATLIIKKYGRRKDLP